MKLTKKVIGSGVLAATLIATTVTGTALSNVTNEKSNYKVAAIQERYASVTEKQTVKTKVFGASAGIGKMSTIVSGMPTIEVKDILKKAPAQIVEEQPILGEVEVTVDAVEDEWAKVLLPNVDESLNVRAEASTDSEAVGILRKGCSAQVEEVGDEWTKISSGDVEGYVKNEYCVYGQDAKALAEEVCSTIVTSKTEGLNVREDANTDADIVDVLAEDETLHADTSAEVIDGWTAVVCGDSTAYVSNDFVDVELQMGKAVTMEEELARIAAEQEAARKAAEEKAAAEKAAAEAAAKEAAAKEAASAKSSGSESSASKSSESTSSSSSSSSSSQQSSVSASSDDVSLLAALIFCEAGGEPYEGQLAVGAVVMNRVRSGSFPNSIREVIYQSGQFTPASSGALSRALSNGSACYSAAQEALSGADNTGGALYFHSGTSGRGTVIGHQIFY